MARAKTKRKLEPTLPSYIGTDTVDNPYDVGPAKIIALRSYRDDPLALMFSRRQLVDGRRRKGRERDGRDRDNSGRHLYEAGRAWQRLYRAAEIVPVQAMDPTKEPVDGGGNVIEALTDHKLAAMHRMNELRALLGTRDEAMLNHVLVAGMSLRDYARTIGWGTAKGYKAVAWQFNRALETVADFCGYA